MRDLFENWIFKRSLQLESLESRYFFSAGADSAAGASVVLIDKNLPKESLLTNAIIPGGKTILFDGQTESAAEVLARTTRWAEVAGVKIKSISLLAHATGGKFELGNQWISNKNLDETSQAWAALGGVLAKGASINLYGCNLASVKDGTTLINRLASLTGAGVHASNNLTGKGGDWVLEAASIGAATQPTDAPLNLAALAAWNADLAPGITVSPISGNTSEAGGTATFTVVLDEAPGLLDTVNIPIASSNTGEGTVSTSSLAFNALNWNTPQTVTVTGVDDHVIDGDQAYKIFTGPASSTDAGYDGLTSADVDVINTDNDVAGFNISPTSGLTTTEAGGTANFNVSLTAQPTADVTISITSTNTAEGTVSTSSLTFTAANWNVNQQVTITGVDDSVDDGNIAYTITTGVAVSADGNFDGIDPADVSVTNTDDDTAGFTVSPTSGLTTTEAGGQASFNVKLNSQPTANVTISIASSDTTEGTVSTSSLTFTPANWNVNQQVTITGVDDAVQDGNIAYTIVTGAAVSSDGKYSGLNPANVSVTNTDNDVAGITVSPTSGLVTTEAGGQDSFDVVLNSQPTANVTISITSNDTTEGTVSTSSLTFTPANWNVAQTVTVTGVDDAVTDGNIAYSIVTGAAVSTDGNYSGMNPSDVSVTNNDNDVAGFTVSPTSGLTTTEAGGQASFNVHLNSQPTASVTIAISSNDTTEGTVSTSSLMFTPANWNVNQQVTVTGVDDAVADGNIAYSIVTGAAVSGDGKYSGLNPSDVSVTNTDNDVAGITVSPTSGLVTTEAGGTASFTVVLTSQPTANVTIGISSGDTTEGTVSTSLLTFDNTNWNTPQTVTITGVDDAVQDGNIAYSIITAAASSADGKYNGINPANVSVTNMDNDVAGVTVSPTSGLTTTEAGGQASFTVKLNSQPTANVTIPISSNNTAEGTVSTASLTFTPGNWNVNQTVTVTGVDDLVADGNIAYSIVTGAATSTDGIYNGMNPSDVSVTNTDNDVAGITVSPTSGLSTTEAGSQTSFDVVLTSQPTANVTIGISSNDTTEGTVSPSSLVFTAANWNVPQTVTISSVDDTIVDGDITYQVVTAAAVSTDGKYSGMNPSDVTVTNYDNDPTGVTASPEFRVNTTTASDQQTFPPNARAVASDGNGNFVVVWSSLNQDGSSYGVYGQRFDSNSNAVGGEFLINQTTANAQQYAHVAADLNGDFVVTWSSNLQDGSGWGVYARRYNSSGVAQGNEFRVNTTTANDQIHSDIAMDHNGNFVIVWSSPDASGNGIFGQRYNASGVAQGGQFQINTTAANDQSEPAIGMDSVGNFIVTWSSTGQDGAGYGVYAQRYNAAGTAQGGEFRVNTTTANDQRYSSVSMDDNGDFVVAWTSLHNTSGGNYNGVFAQRFNASGVAQGSEFEVNTDTNRNEQYPSVSLDAIGEFVITWSADHGSGGSWAVYAQQYTSAGAKRGGQFLVNTYTSGDQQYSAVSLDPIGDYAIVWTSMGEDGSGQGVYGRLYYGGNNPPVNSVPAAQTTNEDTNLTFSSGNGNLVSISDPDAGTNSVQVTLTVTNGTLTLSQTTGLTFTVGDGAGDTTMTMTGTMTNINAAMAGMVYAPTANYNGSAQLTIDTNDLGNFGWGTAQTDSDTVNITVNAVNDPPVLTVPVAQNINEDQSVTFSSGNGNQISVADVDAGSSAVKITLTAANGTMTLSSLTGLTFTTGDGTADPTMVFTGTLANINAALNGLLFAPTADFNGTASVQIVANDQGNTGSGGAQSDTKTVNVNVAAVNDAPVNNVPGAQSTNEDTGLTFSSGNGNQISITDVDANGGSEKVTLTVNNGTLTLSQTTGLTFTTGTGTNNATMVFTGTIANINAALNGMIFNPAANYNGPATLQITTDDQGNSGSGGALSDTDSVAITVNAVNDPPVNSVPGAQTMNEDGVLTFSAGNGNLISISDVDAGNNNDVTVTLTATNGTLTLSTLVGLSFTVGDGTADATMTFSGHINKINTALDGLTFSPTANYNGAATVQIVTNDQGNTGSGGALSDTDTVNITINAVNDAPVLSGTNNLTSINEDNTTSTGDLVSSLIAGMVSEVDASPLSGIAVTGVDNTNGTWQYSTNGGTSWNNFGSPTNANARLLAADASTRVRFVPNANYNGTVSGLTFRAWDQTTGTAGNTADTTTNGGTTAFSTATATASITVNAVNDAPVNTVPGAQSTNEDTGLVFSSSNGNQISIADVDAGGAAVKVTLTATNGVLTLAQLTGLTFTTGDGTADATMTFTGTMANINAALNGLTYSPTLDYNGAATVQIITDDQGNTGSGGALSDSDTVNVTVIAVNDAPVLSGTNNLSSINEDNTTSTGDLVSSLIAGMVNDVDASPLSGIAVTGVDNSNGTWQYSINGGASWNNFGSPTNANARLLAADASTRVRFVPNANYNGTVSGLTFRAWDQTSGVAGSTADTSSNGGITAFSSATATANIVVDAVNDAPVNTVPGAQSTNEDTTLVFSSGIGNQISVADLDANEGTGIVRVTLTASNGVLTLAQTTGLSFITGDGTSDASMSFTGTLANINAALNGLGFLSTQDYNGPASVQIVTNDLGNTGSGGALSDTATVNITVNPVNDAPVLSGTNDLTNINEDVTNSSGDLVSNLIAGFVSEVDAAPLAGMAVTDVDNSNGQWQYSTDGGSNWNNFGLPDDTTARLLAADAQTRVRFVPNHDFNGTVAGLTFRAWDQTSGVAGLTANTTTNGGTTAFSSATATANITVDPVNDAPVNNVPGAQSTNEDTNLVFSGSNGNQITIIDVDAGASPVKVTLTVTHGTLTLSGIAGLTFISGDGTNDSTMVFTGSVANINNALNGLIYSPTTNYNGPATLSITTDDQGNSGQGGPLSDSDSVGITVNAVNDAPVNTVPGAQTTNEDTTLVFSGGNGNPISVADLDANEGTGIVRVTLTATNGTLTLSQLTNLTFTTGDGTADGTMTFTGTLADINAALNGLSFAPNADYNGPASVQITTNDLGNTGIGGALSDTDTVNINVIAVNDAPILTVPGTVQNVAEDTNLFFSNAQGNPVSIVDVDAGNGLLKVTLNAAHGKLTLSQTTGLTFSQGSGTNDSKMTFTGTLANINAALDGMFFSPTSNYNAGGAGFSVSVDDQGNTGLGGSLTDSGNVSVSISPVNDAPVNTAPGPQSLNEDGTLTFSTVGGNAISVFDVDSDPGQLKITLTATNGKLTLNGTTGLTFIVGDGTSDGTMTFTGTQANINAALDGMTYAPNANYNGPAAVSILTDDQGNTGAGGALTDSSTVNVTVNAVNDAPTMTVPGSQSTNEDTNLIFSGAGGNGISVADVDANEGTGIVRITLTATNGTITLSQLTNLTFITGDGTADGTMTFTGTLADINAALDGLFFSPNLNYNGNTAGITATINDLGNTGSGGALSDTRSVNITVNAVNDAPVITLPPPQATNEDTDLVLSTANGNAISVDDIDVNEGTGILHVTLVSTKGTMTLSQTTGLTFTTGDGSGDVIMDFTGTLADINAALDGLTYSPAQNYNGPAQISVDVDDQGNTGQGGTLGDSQTLALTVNAVNDAPVNTVPGQQNGTEDVPITFSTGNGNAISVFDLDVDEGTGLLQITLDAPDGVLTLSGTTGLTFTVGDGTADGTMTFTGTTADINAALQGMVFTPTQYFNSATTIQITTNDQGNTGIGGPLTASDTINIDLGAVNNAPVNTVPAPQAVDEDNALTFSAANGNAMSVFDPDAPLVKVTLTATHGTLTLSGTTGLTFLAGDGTGDVTMTFTGTQADVNAALDGMFYSPVANFNGPAQITFLTDDMGNVGAGGVLTDSSSVAITVNPVNDPPVNTVPGPQQLQEDTQLVFSFGNGNRLLISDLDAANGSMRVILSVTNGTLSLGGTTGLSFSVGDGTNDTTMNFTGTIAQINAAMEGLTYKPFANFAGPAQLTIVTNDRGHSGQGGPQIATDTVDLFVNPVNDPPALVMTPGGILYTENDPPTAIDPGVAASDVDDTYLEGAVISISNYIPGEDVLAFTDQNGITGTWDATNGTLSLSGHALVADYQAALASITYQNLSDNPTGGVRNITFVVGDGALRSNVGQRTVTVVPVNDAPTGTPLSITVEEDAGRTTVDLRALFADAEDPTAALTLSISDVSDKTLFDSIKIDPQTGQLLLDSTQDAFGATTIKIRATDTDGAWVETTVNVTVSPVNDAPIVTTSDGETVFNPNTVDASGKPDRSVTVDDQLKLTDVDSPNLAGATVRILNYVALKGDRLDFVNQNGITGNFDAATGTLQLSGTATLAQYQAALRSVQYTNPTGLLPGEVRQVEFVVNDGELDSAVSSRLIESPMSGPILPPDVLPPPDQHHTDDGDEPKPTPREKTETVLPQRPQTAPSGPAAGEATQQPQTPVTLPPVPPVPAPIAPPKPEYRAVPAPELPSLPPPPPPVPVAIPAPPIAVPAFHAEELSKKLDDLAKDLDSATKKSVINVGSVAGMSTTLLSVGYVIWCLRGGSLVATLLTTLPLWKWLDPLPVLDRHEEKERDGQSDEDEERLRSMMD